MTAGKIAVKVKSRPPAGKLVFINCFSSPLLFTVTCVVLWYVPYAVCGVCPVRIDRSRAECLLLAFVCHHFTNFSFDFSFTFACF